MSQVRLPLFPLNVVLLPGRRYAPAYFLKPRYRQNGARLPGKRNRHSACSWRCLTEMAGNRLHCGKFWKVTSRYDDGRCDILTVGPRAISDCRTFSPKKPLMRGDVDFFGGPTGARETRGSSRELIELYENVPYADFLMIIHANPAESAEDKISYRIASRLPMDLLWKQRVLELRSEAERPGAPRPRTSANGAPHLQKEDTLRRGKPLATATH